MKEVKQEFNWRLFLTVRRYFSLAIAMALVSFLLIVLAIIPQIKETFALQTKLGQEQKMLESLQLKDANLASVSTSQAIAKEATINQVLPSKKPVLELLTSLNAIAAKDKVLFTDLEASPGQIATDSSLISAETKSKSSRSKTKTTQPGYEDMDLKLVIEGSLSGVQQFFSDTEKIAPISSITSITLNSKTVRQSNLELEQDDQVEAEIVIQTYYFTKSIKSALETPLPVLSSSERQILDQLESFILTGLPEQSNISGGGLWDLFGVNDSEDIESIFAN